MPRRKRKHVQAESDPTRFDWLFDDCGDDCKEAGGWLADQLHLPERNFIEPCQSNADPERAIEFAEYYLAHPELSGWRRLHLAALVADAISNLWRRDGLWSVSINDIDRDHIRQLVARLAKDRKADHYIRMMLLGPIGDDVARYRNPEAEQFYHEATGPKS